MVNGIVVIEEWFEIESTLSIDLRTMFPTPKVELAFVNNQYVERTYQLDGKVSCLTRIKAITKKEFYERMDKIVKMRH